MSNPGKTVAPVAKHQWPGVPRQPVSSCINQTYEPHMGQLFHIYVYVLACYLAVFHTFAILIIIYLHDIYAYPYIYLYIEIYIYIFKKNMMYDYLSHVSFFPRFTIPTYKFFTAMIINLRYAVSEPFRLIHWLHRTSLRHARSLPHTSSTDQRFGGGVSLIFHSKLGLLEISIPKKKGKISCKSFQSYQIENPLFHSSSR